MVFSEKDLDRLADDIDKNRRITSSIYCGSCGYNLKTLPYSYQCPECGNDYNARPLHKRGIHEPLDEEFPFAYIIGVVLCGLGVWFCVDGALRPMNISRVVAAGLFLLAGLVTAWRTFERFKRMVHTARIARQIAEAERDART